MYYICIIQLDIKIMKTVQHNQFEYNNVVRIFTVGGKYYFNIQSQRKAIVVKKADFFAEKLNSGDWLNHQS